MLDDGQVMRNEQIRQVHLLLQVFQQVDDLRLDRYVQRGDRLVADDEFRIESERSCDADTLALAAGELMRIAVLVERLQAALVHDVVQIVVVLRLGHKIVFSDGFADDLADRHTRGQRGERILEDDLHLGTHIMHFLVGQIIDFLPVEQHIARRLIAGEAQDRTSGGRLAAAGLADQAHRLAALQVERDTVDRFDVAGDSAEHAVLDREVLLQVSDLQDILRIVDQRRFLFFAFLAALLTFFVDIAGIGLGSDEVGVFIQVLNRIANTFRIVIHRYSSFPSS